MNDFTQKDKLLLNAVIDMNVAKGVLMHLLYESEDLPENVIDGLRQIIQKFELFNLKLLAAPTQQDEV